MKIVHKALFLSLFFTAFCQPVLSVPDHRAQAWKPQHRTGAEQLSISQIDTIVSPEPTGKLLSAAIGDLKNVLQARYGKSPTLVSGGHPKQALYFQRVADGREGGAFTIVRERTRVIVQGADESAWSHALYAIMKDMLGARWYWSGDLGFELLSPSRDYFPNSPWSEQPAFVQRRFYPVNTDFARRNRLNSIYSFNHNLAKVFSPELFESKPEVFAKVNGRRKPPRGSGGTDPQPDFTHPDAVEIAAQAALSHFEANPEHTSFSLSINDNVLFGTDRRTEASVSPLRYFRERPNYTDLVFGFMNRVAERVFDQAGAWKNSAGEDRYLTALAYYWTEPAPSIKIHPRVMPVLTSDRAQWHDPDYRQQDKDLIRAWTRSGAERVATWDYYFGAPYPYPRQFNQWVSESLKYMAVEGVDVFFSQLPSFWGLDGAKAWLGAELLWNPEQDTESLLDEYYTNFFGAAAEPMRAFYETAENYRNEHEGQADWIKLYKDESSVALFTPELMQQMRGHIMAAEAQLEAFVAVGEVDAGVGETRLRFQQRVKVVSEAFRLTELYSAFYQSRSLLVTACLDQQAAPVLTALLADYQQADAAYRSYFDQYFKQAEYTPARRHLELGQSDPSRLVAGLVEAQPQGFGSLSENPKLKHVGQELRNFLGPVLPRVESWHLDYRASEHFKIQASVTASEQDAGIRVSGADIVSIFRTFPVISGKAYDLRLRGTWRTSLDNRVYLHVAWLDRDGKTLESEVSLRLPIEHRSDPVFIRLPYTAPDDAYDVRIRIVVSRQYPGDYLDLSEIDFGMVWEL